MRSSSSSPMLRRCQIVRTNKLSIMGIFDLFKRNKGVSGGKTSETNAPEQYRKALQFNQEFAELLGRDAYIARSDY